MAAPDPTACPDPRIPEWTLLVPGFRGYRQRESLRDDDRVVREHLSIRLRRHAADLDRLSARRFRQGPEELRIATERLAARLRGLAGSLDSGTPGDASLFGRPGTGRRELGRVLGVDLEMVRAAQELGARLHALAGAAAHAENGSYQLILKCVLPCVDGLRLLLDRRACLLLK